MFRFTLAALFLCNLSSLSCKDSEPTVEEFTSDSWSFIEGICSCDTIACASTHQTKQKKITKWWPTMIGRVAPEEKEALEKSIENTTGYLLLLAQDDVAMTHASAKKKVEQGLQKFPRNEEFLAMKKQLADHPSEKPDIELLASKKKECLAQIVLR